MPRLSKEERGQAIDMLATESGRQTILVHNRGDWSSQNAILTNWDIIEQTGQ